MYIAGPTGGLGGCPARPTHPILMRREAPPSTPPSRREERKQNSDAENPVTPPPTAPDSHPHRRPIPPGRQAVELRAGGGGSRQKGDRRGPLTLAAINGKESGTL